MRLLRNTLSTFAVPRPSPGAGGNTCQTLAVETTRPARARFIGVLLTSALGLGLVYGLLIARFGQAGFLLSWWGTFLRGVGAVLICFAIAGFVDRRWSRR
jgi:hypothetical protein